MTIAKAIEALESALPFISELAGAGNEHAPATEKKIRKALAALRSLRPATEEEITLALRDRVDSAVKAWERKVWRLAERRFFGE